MTKFGQRDKSKDTLHGTLHADRAKTQSQLKRNTALRDAMAKLKADPRGAKNKKVEILWKKTDPKDKNREVVIDGICAFRQGVDDISGSFLSPFTDLTI